MKCSYAWCTLASDDEISIENKSYEKKMSTRIQRVGGGWLESERDVQNHLELVR